jgi:hypothetical protein
MFVRPLLPLLALGLGLGLLSAACAGAQPARSLSFAGSPASDGDASPEAVANARHAYAGVFAAVERATAACEQGTATVDADLAAALDEVRHPSPRAEPPGRLLARLKAEHVAFTISFPAGQWTPEVRDGIATRRQQWLAAPRDTKEQAELDELRRTEQSVGWAADELRAQVALFGKAFADAHLDRVTCDLAARQVAAHLLNFDRPELRASMRPELARARQLMRRVARARASNVASEAAATGVFAAYEAAAAHDHPEIVDQALQALEATHLATAPMSEAEVDAAIVKMVHEEANALVAAASERPGDASSALYLAAVTREAEADLTGKAGHAEGIAAPQPGSPGAPPLDLHALTDAMQSVTQGDYRAAVRNVAGYVPGRLGHVLGTARSTLN